MLLTIAVKHEIDYNNLPKWSNLTVSSRNLYIFGHTFRGCFHRECSQNVESAFRFVARSNRLASRIPELNCAKRAGGGCVLCALAVARNPDPRISAFSLILRGSGTRVDLSSQASPVNHRARVYLNASGNPMSNGKREARYEYCLLTTKLHERDLCEGPEVSPQGWLILTVWAQRAHRFEFYVLRTLTCFCISYTGNTHTSVSDNAMNIWGKVEARYSLIKKQ